MMYPCSVSLQALPVPGIGFCQSIFVDRDVVVRPNRGLWPLTAGRALISSEGAPQEATDAAAVGHQLQ
jgi:hypothetical protein